MKFFSRFFIFFFVYSNTFADVANVPIFFVKKATLQPSFLFSNQYYDDVRIIGSGTIWSLKKDGTRILLEYSGNEINQISIKRIDSAMVTELLYQKTSKQVLRLVEYKRRPLEVYNLTFFEHSDAASICASKTSAVSDLNTLKDKISGDNLTENITSKVLDKSCESVFSSKDPSEYLSLVTGATNASTIDIPSLDNSFISCLEDSKTQDLFKNFPNYKDQLQLLSAKYKLELAKINAGSPQVTPLIVCKNASKPEKLSTCSESGQITFNNLQNETKTPNKNDFRVAFTHEMIHRSGVVSEEVADTLVAKCIDGKEVRPLDNNNGRDFAKRSPGLMKSGPIQNGKVLDPVIPDDVIKNPSIPKEITAAQIQAPTQEQINQTVTTANAFTPEGVQQAETQSTQQSTPILNFANLVTGATQPALATTRSLASTGGYVSPAGVSGSASGTSSSGLKPGEQVVEEINASQSGINAATQSRNIASTNNATTTTPAVVAPTTNLLATQKALVAPTSGIPADAAAAAGIRPAGSSSEVSKAAAATTADGTASASSLASGASAPASPQTQTIGRNANPARQPSSVGQADPQPPAQVKITQTILTREYSAVKNSLKKPENQKRLVDNGITVMDLAGNQFGAPKTKGTVIILDNGASFVRQK